MSDLFLCAYNSKITIQIGKVKDKDKNNGHFILIVTIGFIEYVTFTFCFKNMMDLFSWNIKIIEFSIMLSFNQDSS